MYFWNSYLKSQYVSNRKIVGQRLYLYMCFLSLVSVVGIVTEINTPVIVGKF